MSRSEEEDETSTSQRRISEIANKRKRRLRSLAMRERIFNQ